MCDIPTITGSNSVPRRRTRRRLWELESGGHCSVIGTCLTLKDLRILARKLKLKPADGLPIDYELHGYFAHIARDKNRPSKLLNKLLDQRHASSIRNVRAAVAEEELLAIWNTARESGDIPGAYWAILSHPCATSELSGRLFADIHMLSHLTGASNRADIHRLNALEQRNRELHEEITSRQDRHIDRIAERDQRIGELAAEVIRLKSSRATATATPSDVQAPRLVAALKDELDRTNHRASRAEETAEKLRHGVEALNQRLESQDIEIRFLEDSGFGVETVTDANETEFSGLSVLYVGGRNRSVSRIRSIVEMAGGTFDHHDGGVEKSMGELAAAVRRAEIVVFPTDCVSHGAVNAIKRLCHQSMVDFIPVRTCGVASMLIGLRQWREHASLLQAAE